EASTIAAATGMTFGFDSGMSEFASHAVHAVPDFSADDEPSADTGAERKHGHVVKFSCCAEPLFSEGGDVGIVFEDDDGIEAALDFSAHGIIRPSGKVRRFAQQASLHINDAGDTDSDPEHAGGVAVFVREALDGIAHVV